MKKNNALISVTFLLVIVYILHGCRKDDANNSSPAAPAVYDSSNGLMPLKAGNTWIYIQTEMDSLDHVDTTYEVIWQVMDSTLIGSQQWYEVQLGSDSDMDADEYLQWTNKTDGWYENEYGIPTLSFKYPAALNTVFISFSDTLKVTSVVATATVPAGTFASCYQYQVEDKLSPQTWYIKPCTGVIKAEQYNGAHLVRKLELVSYTLK